MHSCTIHYTDLLSFVPVKNPRIDRKNEKKHKKCVMLRPSAAPGGEETYPDKLFSAAGKFPSGKKWAFAAFERIAKRMQGQPVPIPTR